ncbi:BON domain-containing protein [Thermithiobacillus plumbiphilus]|uniref:BON domain-containing protein n=1 Tax=Thermithiobacillus plumbiphilus TaxID=1729899 RepID=A0ABU9D684_9PROT
MRFRSTLLLVLALPPLLSGCAAAVVGGLATGAYVAQDRRSVGSLVDDQVLEVKINNALRSDPQAGYGRIIVSSFNGNVLLAGDVPNQAAKDNATRIANEQQDVKRVFNELHVGPIAPLSDRSRDTWIAAEVKTRLLGAEDHPGLKVKVTVDRGVVYLQGLVRQDEGDWAANVASNVSGVKQVVKVFEYIS